MMPVKVTEAQAEQVKHGEPVDDDYDHKSTSEGLTVRSLSVYKVDIDASVHFTDVAELR
jgi:hypothetical protein